MIPIWNEIQSRSATCTYKEDLQRYSPLAICHRVVPWWGIKCNDVCVRIGLRVGASIRVGGRVDSFEEPLILSSEAFRVSYGWVRMSSRELMGCMLRQELVFT